MAGFGSIDLANPGGSALALGAALAALTFVPTGYPAAMTIRDYVETEAVTTVRPERFGARAGGVLDATAELVAACQSGLTIDGGGRTYGVTKWLRPTSLKGLKNIRLKQLTPGIDSRVLFIENLSDFVLENVTVDNGGNPAVGTLSDAGCIWIANCTDFVVRNCRVQNFGTMNGFGIFDSARFHIAAPQVRGATYTTATTVTDDVQHGMLISRCTEFSVTDPSIIHTGVNDNNGTPTIRFTRGIVLNDSDQWIIQGGILKNWDQPLDITGGRCEQWLVHGVMAYNGGSWGFKAANNQRQGAFIGCVDVGSGRGGFVVSGNPAGGLATFGVDFISCVSYNAGQNGAWAGNPQICGFQVLTNGAQYPRGVRFFGCVADDRQASPTMLYGILCDGAPLGNEYVQVVGFRSYGHAVAATAGLMPTRVHLTKLGTPSVSNNTWTQIDWDVEVDDTNNLHSTSSNVERITIAVAGTYRIYAKTTWAADGNGIRGLRVLKNGGTADAGEDYRAAVAGQASTNMVLMPRIVCAAGDQFRTEILQTSGGSLTFAGTQSYFQIERIDD